MVRELRRFMRQATFSCESLSFALLRICADGLAGPTPEGKGKSTGFLFWVIILPWSVWVLLVTLACRSGLNNRIGVASPEFTRRVDPTENCTHETQK